MQLSCSDICTLTIGRHGATAQSAKLRICYNIYIIYAFLALAYDFLAGCAESQVTPAGSKNVPPRRLVVWR